MELIAALDLIDGRGVRLRQGDYGRLIPGSDDPVGLAQQWASAGVPRLHLVDLDGARAGQPRQLDLVAEIASAARSAGRTVRLQAGGGLRTAEAVDAVLSAGVDDAILGTAALERPGFVTECAAHWPGRILVSLDLRDGRPALDGWRRAADHDPISVARALLAAGAAGVLITDTHRDGMLGGPNLEVLEAFRKALPDSWLAGAGGVSSEADLLAMRDIGLDGAVVGLALLTGGVRLPSAVAMLAAAEVRR